MAEIVEINTEKMVVTRAEAREKGLQRYFTGKPCRHRHVSERYTSNGICIACMIEHDIKRKSSGASAAAVRKWRAANSDRYLSEKGWNYARERGATLPSDFKTPDDLIRAAQPLYTAVRRLTEETGVPNAVDHIVPVVRGGEHHPSNLRVVTWNFNWAKRSKTDAECLTEILNGTWRGPMDAMTILMLVNSVRYDTIVNGTTLRIAA